MITAILVGVGIFVVGMIIYCAAELASGKYKNVTTVYTHKYRNGDSVSYIFPPDNNDDK